MQRPFFRDLLICLVPLLLAGYVSYRAYGRYEAGEAGGFKLGVDLSGGTILVYEVDRERTLMDRSDANAGQQGEADIEIDKLAEALKKRIDGNDLYNITVRPAGSNRIEIIMPTGKVKPPSDDDPKKEKRNLTSEEVEEKKAIIGRVGSLEFRILANDFDDGDAIKAAKAFFAQAVEVTPGEGGKPSTWRANTATPEGQELQKADEAGRPPPPPRGDFIALGDPATYSWVEIGKQERYNLGLDNEAETITPEERAEQIKKKKRGGTLLWPEVAAARAKGEMFKYTFGSEGKNLTAYIWSRPYLPKKDAPENANKKYEYFFLTRASDNVKVGGEVTVTARYDTDQRAKPVVAFQFNSAGANRFYKLTSKNAVSRESTIGGKPARSLAVILDGKIISAPSINEAIGASGIIQGDFTKAEVDQIVELLRSGALPATLKPLPVSENAIGPTLGADTIKRGTWAVLWAFVAVLLFMLVYYRFAGLVACIALMANLLLTVGFMAAVNATFTLPGLAGLVLMLGMAVDANVLIYERVREERDKGANLLNAIRNGYDRAFPTIIDTHLSSIFTCLVLYAVGNDQLKGFAVALTAGLVISLFTSLFMTRLIFDYFLHRKWLSELKMMRILTKTNIDFMRLRPIVLPIIVFLTIAGVGLFAWRGEDAVNVDFRGGTVYGGQLKDGLTITELRDTIDGDRQAKELEVESVVADAGSRNTYLVKYKAEAQPTRVTLATDAEGDTDEAKLADVKLRVGRLPDSSIEQLFLRDESLAEGKSRFFTIRTTEREPQLVQAAIDRLFQKPGDEVKFDSLLAKTDMKVERVGNKWVLRFFKAGTNEPMPTSQSFVSTLLEQSFSTALTPEQRQAGRQLFELAGKGDAVEGRFTEMTLEPGFVAFDPKVAAGDMAAFAGPFEAAALAAAYNTPGVAVNVSPLTVAPILKDVTSVFEARPLPERLETFDPTLAAETRSRALIAILASWVAILMYLWFRFGSWTFGLAAVVCLIHDLCFTLGIIAVCHYLFDTPFGSLFLLQDFKIDLPAIAALLTLVGYSVNDTIVVFDRIKEVRGKNPILNDATINQSVNQTLSRTILASLTTWLVVLVLYIFGGEGVHLFAFVMVIGVVVGTYSSIYVAAPLLLLFGEGKPVRPNTTASAKAAKLVPEPK